MARKTYTYSRKELSTRAMVPLTKQMDSYLRQIQDLCKGKGGRYLDRSQVIRALILALQKCEGQVDLQGVKDEEELVRRLVRAFSRR